ncbi:beta-ketoacyl synthase N-terminal-like domain-containing protein, partial [Actinosynnema sp. NPDC023658]|uniref:beta-ketoacyl synthase N-terminal-like domain-containing protein n=1 Tax=Actinosynnema sp. NPDC023658 TaxID=3155465 RepID=UPI0033CF97AB
MSTAPDTLAITGWGVLTSTGTGADEFSAAVREGRGGLVDVEGAFDDELPESKACALVGFHARDYVGRKGTAFLDRSTALALVGCHLALADTGLVVDDTNRDRLGIVLGTTAGSFKSTSDYSRETLVQDKPYLVNPVLFPNTVMNCAAGQAAIWHKLKGVNATVAGGQLAGLNALRYTRNLVRRGYVDGALVGAVEEFSPHTAWGTHNVHERIGAHVPLGEGSAVFVAENPDVARAAGRAVDAEVLAVEIGSSPTGDTADGLASCVTRALERAGVHVDDVWAVATGETGVERLDRLESLGVARSLGAGPRRVRIKELAGE